MNIRKERKLLVVKRRISERTIAKYELGKYITIGKDPGEYIMQLHCVLNKG